MISFDKAYISIKNGLLLVSDEGNWYERYSNVTVTTMNAGASVVVAGNKIDGKYFLEKTEITKKHAEQFADDEVFSEERYSLFGLRFGKKVLKVNKGFRVFKKSDRFFHTTSNYLIRHRNGRLYDVR